MGFGKGVIDWLKNVLEKCRTMQYDEIWGRWYMKGKAALYIHQPWYKWFGVKIWSRNVFGNSGRCQVELYLGQLWRNLAWG